MGAAHGLWQRFLVEKFAENVQLANGWADRRAVFGDSPANRAADSMRALPAADLACFVVR